MYDSLVAEQLEASTAEKRRGGPRSAASRRRDLGRRVGVRWEGDERGRGVADARRLAAGARELVTAMEAEAWVAEQPEAHLLPHLERAAAESPFELLGSRTEDNGTFAVDVRWRGNGSIGAVRQALFALVGSFAESATYVRQRREGEAVAFEVATGMLEDRNVRPHGHTVRFDVRGVFG